MHLAPARKRPRKQSKFGCQRSLKEEMRDRMKGGGSAKQRAHASMVGSAKFRSGSLGQPCRLLPGLGLGACARTCPPACQSRDCRSRRRWEAGEDGLQTKSCELTRLLCRARAHVRESSEEDVVHRGRERSGQNFARKGRGSTVERGGAFSLHHITP